MKFNIYAGSCNEATFIDTVEAETADEAYVLAYEAAVEDYRTYEGMHGLRDWGQIAESMVEEGTIPCIEGYEDDVDIEYSNEIDTWINYWAVGADEDPDWDYEKGRSLRSSWN